MEKINQNPQKGEDRGWERGRMKGKKVIE